jgi:hypothetical protein
VTLTVYSEGGTALVGDTAQLDSTFTAGWVDFDFGLGISVTPGAVYVIGLAASIGDGNDVSWGYQSSPNYPDGTGASGFFFQTVQPWDYLFETYYTDATPPVITPHLTETVAGNNWYKTAVTLTWTVTDPESGDSLVLTNCGPTLVSVDQPITPYTCSATSTAGPAPRRSPSPSTR